MACNLCGLTNCICTTSSSVAIGGTAATITTGIITGGIYGSGYTTAGWANYYQRYTDEQLDNLLLLCPRAARIILKKYGNGMYGSYSDECAKLLDKITLDNHKWMSKYIILKGDI